MFLNAGTGYFPFDLLDSFSTFHIDPCPGKLNYLAFINGFCALQFPVRSAQGAPSRDQREEAEREVLYLPNSICSLCLEYLEITKKRTYQYADCVSHF